MEYAVVGHPSSIEHLERIMLTKNLGSITADKKFLLNLYRSLPKFLNKQKRKLLLKFFELSNAIKTCDISNLLSKTGQKIDGFFITYPVIPGLTNLTSEQKLEKLKSVCHVAKKYGAKIVGLGAFSSIDDGNQGALLAKYSDVAVTNGNTLTAAATLQGIYKSAERLGLTLKEATVAIIGASGDVGSGCARVLSNKVNELILTARNVVRLEEFSRTIEKNRSKVNYTNDNLKAISRADIVITCASGITRFINADAFKKDAIVCDVGFPKNVSYEYSKRKDLFVFSGGLMKLPSEVEFGVDLDLPKNVVYGCFAEAMVLAFEKRFENFSIGRGSITSQKIDYIWNKAKINGFELAPFSRGKQKIS